MKVVCISEKSGFPVKIGNLYEIPNNLIWIDSDGDAYGVICDINTGKHICQMLLKHFLVVKEVIKNGIL